MCVRITALVTYNYESVLEKGDFAINLYVLPPPYSLQHSKVNCCCFKYSNELSLTWNINERLKGLKHVSKKRMSQLWLSNKYFPFVGASLITLYLYGQSSFYWLTGFLSVSMCEQVFPLLWFFYRRIFHYDPKRIDCYSVLDGSHVAKNFKIVQKIIKSITLNGVDEMDGHICTLNINKFSCGPRMLRCYVISVCLHAILAPEKLPAACAGCCLR